jgi:hypothetical protein
MCRTLPTIDMEVFWPPAKIGHQYQFLILLFFLFIMDQNEPCRTLETTILNLSPPFAREEKKFFHAENATIWLYSGSGVVRAL